MQTRYKLLVSPQTYELENFYREIISYTVNFDGTLDRGQDYSVFDLYIPDEFHIQPGKTKLIDYSVKLKMIKIESVLDNDNNVNLITSETGYGLYPKLSISKTPLFIANSVHVIDKNYRGNIICPFHHLLDTQKVIDIINVEKKIKTDNNEIINQFNDLNKYTIKKNSRLIQVCAPGFSTFEVELVSLNNFGSQTFMDSTSSTISSRGADGLSSTES